MKQLFRLSMVLIALVVIATGCAKKINFESSMFVPNAEGSVKIKKDKNRNYSVKVKTINLAPPDKLVPPRSLYVVWMRTEFNGTKNIGQMTSSKPLFSKKLKAKISTVSPYKPVQVFITGEENGNVTFPSLQSVLTTGLFNVR